MLALQITPILRLDWDLFPSSFHWRVVQICSSLFLLPWVAHVCQEWLLEAAANLLLLQKAKCLTCSLFVNCFSSPNSQANVLCFRYHAYSFSTLLWARFSQYRSSIVCWTQFCVVHFSAKSLWHLCMDQPGSRNFETGFVGYLFPASDHAL